MNIWESQSINHCAKGWWEGWYQSSITVMSIVFSAFTYFQQEPHPSALCVRRWKRFSEFIMHPCEHWRHGVMAWLMWQLILSDQNSAGSLLHRLQLCFVIRLDNTLQQSLLATIAQKLQKGCGSADQSRLVIALVCSVFTCVSSKLLPVLHLNGFFFVIVSVDWPCFYFLADTFPWP